eukprot:jgi/Galph1/4835/GphlegSOOS_G3460.1
MAHLKQLVRQRLQEEVFSLVKGSACSVLVVDRYTLSLVSAVFRMSEVVSQGISLIEQLEDARTPLPEAEAIFSADSITFHLLFVRHLQDNLFQQVQLSGALIKKVKTLKELYLDFIAREELVFSLERPAASVLQLYNKDKENREEELAQIADRLVTLFYSFGFDSFVSRYSKSSFLSKRIVVETSKRLQQLYDWAPRRRVAPPIEPTLMVLERGSDLVSVLLHEFTYQAMCYDLACLDRSSTNGSVFQYNYSDASGNVKKGQGVLEDESDLLWKRLRHQHIADAIKELDSELRAFASTNKAAQLQQKSKKTDKDTSSDRSVVLKELSAALRSFPEYQEKLSRYSLHQELMMTCITEYERRNLRKVAELEQNIATGRNAEGDKIKQRESMKMLFSLLSDTSLREEDRLRLVLIVKYLSCEMRKMFLPYQLSDAALPILGVEGYLNPCSQHSMNIIKGLDKFTNFWLSLQLQEPSESTSSTGTKGWIKKKLEKRQAAKRHKKYINGEAYELSRYHPPLKRLLVDLIEGCLSTENFQSLSSRQIGSASPSSNEAVSGRPRAGSVRHRKGSSAGIKERPEFSTGDLSKEALSWSPSNYLQRTGNFDETTQDVCHKVSQRCTIIVFFLGGISLSEVRVAYELSERFNVDIYIGGTSILVPGDVLNILAAYENESIARELLEVEQSDINVPPENDSKGSSQEKKKKDLAKTVEKPPNIKNSETSRKAVSKALIGRSTQEDKRSSPRLLDPSLMLGKLRSFFHE